MTSANKDLRSEKSQLLSKLEHYQSFDQNVDFHLKIVDLKQSLDLEKQSRCKVNNSCNDIEMSVESNVKNTQVEAQLVRLTGRLGEVDSEAEQWRGECQLQEETVRQLTQGSRVLQAQLAATHAENVRLREELGGEMGRSGSQASDISAIEGGELDGNRQLMENIEKC